VGIVDRVTVTQFDLVTSGIQYIWNPDGSFADIVILADVRLFNADGRQLHTDILDVPLSAGEKAVLKAKLDDKKVVFSSTTGWTEISHVKEEV